ncbi:hypothetical protein RD792_002587 [Penstemon davidsonii]|uniref:Amino acid transporter transmembrane domain-containing protein n=1 Tax=Penstemon davidsonii TaxID=160366 RepID=A0ABR0DS54_9LAMI|nr:hypothetical protein RD792_002587 [Penstemon davidsonii]
MGLPDKNEPIPLLQLGSPSPTEEDLFDSDFDRLVNSSPKRTGSLPLRFPISFIVFSGVTFISTFFLCNSYRSPDPDYGPIRNRSYIEAVKLNLGKRNAWICGMLIQINLYGTGIAYTITTAICMRAIQRSNCYHDHGHDAPCISGNTSYMLLFGLVQIFMSQIPDFHSMEWLSILAAIMSFSYSSIGLGLGAAKVLGNGVIEGSIYGVSTSTGFQKMWLVSQAIGDIAFAYPYSMIVLEIQDTLKSPPSESQTMKRASVISISITTFFYLTCGGFGYAALGNQTPGNLLTGFGFYEPYWLIDFANVCIVFHLIGGYQVYSQPVFALMDKWLAEQFPQSTFVNKCYILKFPFVPALSLNLQRLCFRTAYVASTTAIAMVFPYFNQAETVLNNMGITETPLLQSVDHLLNSTTKRTGTIWTAVAHIITGVIGSGVLSLAWSMAQLGWIAGPISMVFFATVTLISVILVCDCYRYPDPVYGPLRNISYIEAVQTNLGEKKAWICGILMQINFFGTGIAYVMTSAKCMRAIKSSNCYHEYGHDAPCEFGDTWYMLLFGVVQILISQIPDFHSMAWLSVVAAILSFAYSSIGLGLGAAQVIGNGVIEGSTNGISASTAIQKVLLVSQAIGDIAFAYPYSMIVLNIQDTLRSPPSESETMKKASVISIGITTFFYLSCGGFGYAAFGDQTPGNILTGFGYYEPYWLIDFANACIALHLVGGYQVYSQPVFAEVDKWFAEQFTSNTFVNRNYTLKIPFITPLNLNLGRLCFRTAYVGSTTAIAMILPYFNQVLGVLGAFNFWPLAIYFPVEMCLRQKKIGAWTTKWILLRTFSIVCFILTMFAFVGSIQGLVAAKFTR